ncbi:DUF1168-domain-containing protein, partial [Rhizodiscina lignyota]
MSEPIPESIPTSDGQSKKKDRPRGNAAVITQQSAQIATLMKHPEREVELPHAKRSRGLAPPPEIVANVQGSSAGAGSGEFHVYKASRRRETERLRMMDEQVEKEKRDAEHVAKMAE